MSICVCKYIFIFIYMEAKQENSQSESNSGYQVKHPSKAKLNDLAIYQHKINLSKHLTLQCQ